MDNRKLNLDTVVAIVFIFIFIAATVTTVFGQDKSGDKKERTKIVQLKIVEDENGEVKSIDTTFVAKGDNFFDEDWLDDMHWVQHGDSMNYTFKLNGHDFEFMDIDSLLHDMDFDFESLKGIDNGVFFYSPDGEGNLEDMIREFSFDMESTIKDGDSLMEVIIKRVGNCNDSLMKTHFRNFKVDSRDGNVFIFSDGENVEIDEDGDTKVFKLKNGDHSITWTGDTIIRDGKHKFIIRSSEDGDDTEHIFEYTTDVDVDSTDIPTVKVIKTENGKKIIIKGDSLTNATSNYMFYTDDDEDAGKKMNVMVMKGDKDGKKTVTVKVVKGGDGSVWVTDDEEVIGLEGKKYEFKTPEEEDIKNLEATGVKTKNRDLAIENLKFSPNPSNGRFNLSFYLKEKKKVTINIYDINGNVVYTETIRDFQGQYNKEIDLSDQESGTFFLQIVQGLYDIIKKIIIQ